MGGFFFLLSLQVLDISSLEQSCHHQHYYYYCFFFFFGMYVFIFCRGGHQWKFYLAMEIFFGRTDHIYIWNMFCCLVVCWLQEVSGEWSGAPPCWWRVFPGRCGPSSVDGDPKPAWHSELGVFGSPPLWDFWTRAVQAVHGWVSKKACHPFGDFRGVRDALGHR